jgi:hypothetical protein
MWIILLFASSAAELSAGCTMHNPYTPKINASEMKTTFDFRYPTLKPTLA